eukprot:scaffold19_cov114-Cylindrotheca_fusiformis.AAC.23
MNPSGHNLDKVQEAPTPTISNRTAPPKNVPPLSLSSCGAPDDGFSNMTRTPSSSNKQASKRTVQPLFSSATASPIIVTRKPTASPMPLLQIPIETSATESSLAAEPSTTSPSGTSLALVSRDFSNLDGATPLNAIPLAVVCDFFKAGVPHKLLRNVILRVLQILLRYNGHTSFNRGLAFRTSHTTNHKQDHGTRQIRGIPNYGQTCFLNSILQTLASLKPFLVYLDRIVEVRNELSLGDTSASPCFSQQLLDILHAINGGGPTTKRVVDPRRLLEAIAQHNSQFRSIHLQQQDAQELLQTLMDIVVADAQLDGTSSSDQYLRFMDQLDVDDYDEILTDAIAGRKSCYDWQPTHGSEMNRPEGGDLVSLPDIVHQIESEYREGTIVDDRSQRRTSSMREEKKQEEDEIVSDAFPVDEKMPFSKSKKPTNEIINGDPKTASQELTASMQIMKSTLSSITPSPLSGWIGSALQCCKCHNTRPIQNAPFLNIPLVPTSVLEYHSTAHQQQAMFKAPSRSPLPACTLDQCLLNFTTVEQVHDVECRTCLIQKELHELEEEDLLLRSAISSMEKRIRRRGGDPSRHTQCLRDDLSRVEVRMMKLNQVDPDDEDIWLSDTPLGEDEFAMSQEGVSEKPLERCAAMKCLTLTRCPSVLCCHIQRRYVDPLTGQMEKCVQFVEFPQTLDLSPYCAYSPGTNTAWAAGRSRDSATNGCAEKNRMPYRLQGVIEHRGNAHGGHYVSYRRDQKGDWFRISDANVSPIPWRQVRTCQAYMLFYEAL